MDTSEIELTLKKEILKLIQNKVFLGRYIERRYVESLEDYRDIIIIESTEDIAESLLKTKTIVETYVKDRWIGISNNPQNSKSNDCLLWVQLNDVPVGKHWFQMNALTIAAQEIILEVQHVQRFQSPDKSFNSIDPTFPKFDIKEIFTYANIRETIRFSAIVIIAFITFAVEALRYLGEYSIQLGHILVSLVHVSTPICLGMFEFLTKCVGGFYWLIYVLINGTPNTPIVPTSLMSNQRQSNPRTNFRAIEYKSLDYSRSRQDYPQDWNKYQRNS